MHISEAGFCLLFPCVDPLIDAFDIYLIFFSVYSHYFIFYYLLSGFL